MEMTDVSGFILMKSFSAKNTNQDIKTNRNHHLAFIISTPKDIETI